MKKIIAFFLVITLSLQSCMSPHFVSAEPKLKIRYVGLTVNEVISVLGNPDLQTKSESGQMTYVYLKNGFNEQGLYGQRFTRLSFDDNGIVRHVLSDTTEEGKKYDGTATFFLVVVIIGGIVGGLYYLAKSANTN